MEFIDKVRNKPSVQKIMKFFPAIAFLGGFGWDSITLGMSIDDSDLWFLLAYYTGALILVILLSARLEHPEGWTKERLAAAAAAQPVRPAAKSTAKTDSKAEAKVETKVEPPAEIKAEAPKPATAAKAAPTGKLGKAAEMAAGVAANAAGVAANAAGVAAKATANAAANAAGATARAAANAAGKLADKVGYESTAIPQNAIVVEHHFLDREWSPVWKDRFTWALQFFFGGMFSALVVCYFKSSGSIASFILVILLAILLVGNEFLKKHYESFGLNLALFCLLGTMFMNFTIPHVVHRIGFGWFFLSTLLSFGICTAIWKISRRSKGVLIAPALISILLVVAYLMNWVPPVPLVLKQHMACQNFDKATYTCDMDEPTFLQKIGLGTPTVHKQEGNEVYFLASVYAPAKLKAEIEYRWYYEDPTTEKFKLTDKISSGRMVINGGRETGFRSFSRKKNAPPGKYRVEIAYKNGAVIGAGAFEVFDATPEDTFVRDTLQ